MDGNKTFLACLLLITPFPLHALLVGSNTTPSRQAAATFVSSGNADNEMRGFAIFENGFTLTDSATTCSFNSYMPVSGTLALNNGVLNLTRNLVLQNPTSFTSLGTINGNVNGTGYHMEFQTTATAIRLPSQVTPFIVNNLEVVLKSDVILQSPLQFKGECTVTGNGNTLDIRSGSLVVANGATVIFKDLTLRGIAANKLYCTDSVGTVSLANVICILDSTYSFTQGRIDIVGDVAMRGAQQFTLATNQPCTIASQATWYFDSGMTFRYAPSNSSQTLLTFANQLSTLRLYETTLWASTVGLQLTKGTIVVEGRCPLKSDGTLAAAGIILGDGLSAANDITIKYLDESGFDVQTGFVVTKNMR